jgi:hypothetical protein
LRIYFVFPKKEWFRNLVNDLNVSRRGVAHMADVDPSVYTLIHAAFIMGKQLKAKSSVIPVA